MEQGRSLAWCSLFGERGQTGLRLGKPGGTSTPWCCAWGFRPTRFLLNSLWTCVGHLLRSIRNAGGPWDPRGEGTFPSVHSDSDTMHGAPKNVLCGREEQHMGTFRRRSGQPRPAGVVEVSGGGEAPSGYSPGLFLGSCASFPTGTGPYEHLAPPAQGSGPSLVRLLVANGGSCVSWPGTRRWSRTEELIPSAAFFITGIR